MLKARPLPVGLDSCKREEATAAMKPTRCGGCRERRSQNRVANSSGRPRRLCASPPADPDVRDYGIRLLESRVCCFAARSAIRRRSVDAELLKRDVSLCFLSTFRDSAHRFPPLAPGNTWRREVAPPEPPGVTAVAWAARQARRWAMAASRVASRSPSRPKSN